MKIREYGKQKDPVVLLLDETDNPIDGETAENYHIIQACPEQRSSESDWNELYAMISSKYQGRLFAITSVAQQWELAQKLLLSQEIHCDKAIIEGREEIPRHFIVESLKEAAKCQTANCGK